MKIVYSKTLDVNKEDYDIRQCRGGQIGCNRCPFVDVRNGEFGKEHTCFVLFEKEFGGDCCKIRVTKKRAQ